MQYKGFNYPKVKTISAVVIERPTDLSEAIRYLRSQVYGIKDQSREGARCYELVNEFYERAISDGFIDPDIKALDDELDRLEQEREARESAHEEPSKAKKSIFGIIKRLFKKPYS